MNLERAQVFLGFLCTDIQKVCNGVASQELKNSVLLRIAGVAMFALGLYVGAPAVVAWLTNQPGAFTSLFFAVIWIVSGHELAVVGDNESTALGAKIVSSNGVSPSGVFESAKHGFSALKDKAVGVAEGKKTDSRFTGTWVLKHVFTVVSDTPARQ
jgi:hypothetical protein